VSPIGWHPSPLSRWADLLSVNALVFGSAFILVIAWRWARASTAERRLHWPVWSAMVVTNAVLGGGAITSLVHRGDIGQLLSLAYGIGLVTLPFVYLSGVLRAHRRITDLMLALEHAVSPSQLRDLLAEALGDPTLVVGFWTGTNEYTGVDGTPVTLPHPPKPRTLTWIADGDDHLAVLVHDPAVATRPALVRTVVAAARLALSNARLQAPQRRQLDELRASRERIAVAALDERQRIELEYAEQLIQAIPRGVGYLLKERATSARELLDAIDRVADGAVVFDPDLVTRLIARPRADNPLHELTPRESEVLALMAEELGNHAIAKRLRLSRSTVEKHASAIFRKLRLDVEDAGDNARVRAVLSYLRHTRHSRNPPSG
jgi:DNA-binding NarL/FixJ family response regulator